MAPSAARASAYLERRQRDILGELRGLSITWVIIFGVFTAITVAMSQLS